MTDNLIREIDEDVRRDQMKALWDRYGVFLVGVVVFIVAATAGYQGWQAWQANRAATAGDRFLEAVDAAQEEKFAEAAAILGEVGASGGGAYFAIARLRDAALKSESGDVAGAITEFEAIAADAVIDRTFRDLAQLRAAYLMVDTQSFDAVSAVAEPHATPDGAWRHFAREILGLSAYRVGDVAAARTWFETLVADTAAPQNARGRAELILSLLGPVSASAGKEAQQ